MSWFRFCANGLGVEIFWVVVDMPASDGSDSVVEKETLGLRSTSDVSNVELIDGWVISDVSAADFEVSESMY